MRTVAALCRELTTDRRHDGELLAAFLHGPSEDAFAELVRRHGPLVWGACRRALPDPADAEDAFQATFLVLVRRAGRLIRVPALGPWLHRVAVWTARNARRKNARRLARRTTLPDHLTDPTVPPDPDLKADLDSALLALPARYRDPIVLCHLLGFSRREAAERLGCPEGTLSAWLNRGITKLRARLRGLDPTHPLTAAPVAVPTTLAASTVSAAASAAGGVPPAVTSLVEGVLHMLWIKKATAAAVALAATFAMGVGVGVSTRTEHAGAGAQDKAPTDPKKPPTGAQPKDDLPPQLAREFVRLQAQLDAAVARQMAAVKSAEAASDKETVERFQKEADLATEQVKILKAKLDRLKAPLAANPQPPKTEVGVPDEHYELSRLDEKLAKLKDQQDAALTEALVARRRLEVLEARAKELSDRAALLEKQREEFIKRGIGAQSKASLELGIVPTRLPQGEYTLTETDAAGKLVGTVTTREPAMLKKLLTRIRNDTAAPKTLRVIADPSATMTGHPVAVLKACDAAGYHTVTFTGYVFQGGLATPLKTNQTGDAAGYKRYDGVERTTDELVKEIEEGMKRF